MNTLHTYLPQDRLRALAHGESLPNRTSGAVLFADISGFTPLTEALRESLGPRHGAEELTQHLDAVYTALVAEIERYGGSVIGFAGDAITCWFDDRTIVDGQQTMVNRLSSSVCAVTCAFALQRAMEAFKSIRLPNGTTTALALKVAVASGPARRFVVGDPNIYYLDALAGATVARTSTGEHLSQRGDILVDEVTAQQLSPALSIREWRTALDGNERFALVEKYSETISPIEQPSIPELSSEQLRDWLHKAQLEREQSFLTEFRPCAVLFVRFSGIDYDSDEAECQLDTFVRQMQVIATRYEGTLLQLTIGDKGSYAYINFGAFSTHEDDARRAIKTALDLKKAAEGLGFLAPLQIGLTQGTLRVGAYGGQTRRTYGALGDEVNLAARLMSTAGAGEILLGGQIQKATANDFVSEPRPPLPMKGKAEPLPVFAVTGERKQRAIRLQEPTYALPMIGRTTELQAIAEKLNLAANGQAQVIGIVAEAGMGKSRLAAEVIRLARKKGFAGYGGACQSDAIHTPYHVWKTVWSAFFGVDPELPLRKQIRLMEGEIEDRTPERVEALPLLGALLNLEIPENDFTKTLEPKDRKSVLHTLLKDCLDAAAQDEPLLIILEDLHWIDALSHDLLEELARALTGNRICFVLAFRPPQIARLVTPRIETLPNFTKIELHELNAAEAEQAIRAKLAQLYPARGGALPGGLVDKLMARAQGNPFYLEELLNFLRDRGFDPFDPHDLNKIELPDSLHALILSRFDQLSEDGKTTLRVASIIGRLFRAEWLMGYYPELGELTKVKTELDQLAAMDITPLDTPEPELAYVFKHIVTHEVTYESLPFATRAKLHEQLAQYLENIAAPLEVIAHQYGKSNNHAKTFEYAARAGDAAFRVYATTEAIAQYSLALASAKHLDAAPLIDTFLPQVYNNRGRAFELSGRYIEALANYDEMEAQARARNVRVMELASLVARALLRSTPTPVADAALGKTLSEQALTLAQALGDRHAEVTILRNLMLLNNFSGFLREAVNYGEASLALARELGLHEQAAETLNDLFRPYASIGEYEHARRAAEEARVYWRENDKSPMLADNLSRSARIAWALGEFEQVIAFSAEARQISQNIGNVWGLAFSQMFVGYVHLERGDFTTAIAAMKESIQLSEECGFVLPQIATRADLGWVYGTLGAIRPGVELARSARAIAEQRMPTFRSWTLACLARLYILDGQLGEAERALSEGYALFTEDFAQHAPIEMSLAVAELRLAKGDYAQVIGVIDGLVARLRPLKIRTFLSEALYLKGQALLGLVQVEAAYETFQAARAEAEALGSRRIQWQSLVALGEIEKQRGHVTEAEVLCANAYAILEYIVAHMPEDLVSQFLSLSNVKALSEHTSHTLA